METKLAENIRRFRKERSLTQEQLSEVLGVTAGAVHKWEAKLSVPDLDLIVEMADFFDTSVDVLLGYEMKDNRLQETVRRLMDYRQRKDREGLAEAEKALKKYPNAFGVVHESANLYRVFGSENDDPVLLRRTLELLQQCLLLLPQNTDPQISEQTLYGQIAGVYCGLNEHEKAIELWKAHNAGSMYAHDIGRLLADCVHFDEAVPYLSEALVMHTAALIHTVIGYLNVYFARNELDSAQAVIRLGIALLSELKSGEKPNYFDKIRSMFLAVLAGAQLRSGQTDEARATLKEALDNAKRFDAAPSYEVDDIRFVTHIEGASVYDDLGATAMESLEKVIPTLEDEALSALWKDVKEQENDGNNE